MNTDNFTLWLDGKLDAKSAAAFEADPEALAARAEWRALRNLLVSELKPSPLPSPDFVNARVLEQIERESRPARQPAGIRRLTFAGIFSLATAAILALIFLPDAFRRPDESEFISQVVSASAGNAIASVSSFQVPDEPGVVLWLDGTKFIPSEENVR